MSSDKLHLNGLSTEDINPYPIDSPEISPSVFSISHDETLTKAPSSLNIDGYKRQFKLFGNQVAGTLPMLHSDGLLYKPLKTDLEMTFYKNIIEWLPSIKPYIPKYSGIQYIKINTNESTPSTSTTLQHIQTNDNLHNDHQHEEDLQNDMDIDTEFDFNGMEDEDLPNLNNEWSSRMFKKNKHRIAKMPFLILEDVTQKYIKPCILDLKIGTRHFAPFCRKDKKDRKLRKAWCSTCKDFGVRIGGIQIYDNDKMKYNTISKDKAMRLEKNEFINKLSIFFNNAPDDILNKFIIKLVSLMDVLKDENRFRWFSCSLLFVYEGYDDDDDNDNEQSTYNNTQNKPQQFMNKEQNERKQEQEKDKNKEKDGEIETNYNDVYTDPDKLVHDLRLIDFTNFVNVKNYLDELTKDDKEQTINNNNNNDIEDEDIEEEEEEDKNGEYLQLNKDLDNLNEPDHGILFGLDSLIKLLQELSKNGDIKSRNDSEWSEFRDNISYSKKALIPFSNRDDFNEHTVI